MKSSWVHKPLRIPTQKLHLTRQGCGIASTETFSVPFISARKSSFNSFFPRVSPLAFSTFPKISLFWPTKGEKQTKLKKESPPLCTLLFHLREGYFVGLGDRQGLSGLYFWTIEVRLKVAGPLLFFFKVKMVELDGLSARFSFAIGPRPKLMLCRPMGSVIFSP